MQKHAIDGDKLYVRIASSLRAMIEDGSLRPGDKLPALAHLATDFGCSRATVREALGALRGQGLVELRHGDGTYVRTASVEMWMEPLDAAILLGEGQVVQLVELLTTLLAGLATYAARRCQQFDDSELKQLLFALECADRPSEEAVATEMSFYAALAACAGNPLLENALRVLQEALRSSLRVFQEVGGHRHALLGLENCRRVYDLVRAGDDVGVRELVFRYGDKLGTELAELRRSRRSRG